MKKRIIILLLIGLPFVSIAQESSDYGLFFGLGYPHYETVLPVPGEIPSLGVGGFYRKNLNPRYALRFGGVVGLTPTWPPAINPDAIDIHGLVEFNFLPLNPRFEKPKVSTFVASGLAWSGIGPAIPFNVGAKYRVTEKFGLNLEWNIRRRIGNGWFSYLGISAHYNIVKTCKTCPYYESTRKKRR